MSLHDAVVRAGWTQPLGYIVICLQNVQWSGLGKHGCLWTHIEFSALLVWGQGCIGQGTQLAIQYYWYRRARSLFFLRLIINYYLDRYLRTGTWIFIVNTGLLMGARFCFGTIDFIVIILTLASSNNFVCIFLYLQRASLVGFFIFLFILLFYLSLFYLPFSSFLFLIFLFSDLVFFYLSFFVFLVLAFTSFLGSSPFIFFPSFFAVLFFCPVLLFVSFQSILDIFWCAICVTVIINLSVILSTLHLCYSCPCFLWSLGWCRPDVARTVLCLCCRSVV